MSFTFDSGTWKKKNHFITARYQYNVQRWRQLYCWTYVPRFRKFNFSLHSSLEQEGDDKAAGLINSIPCQLQGPRCLKSTSVGKTSLAEQSTYGKLWVKGTPTAVNTPQDSELPFPDKATSIYLFTLHEHAGSSCSMAPNVMMRFSLNGLTSFRSHQSFSKP